MRVFPACFEHFLQSGKPCSNFKSKGLQYLSVDSIELDDVNEAEEIFLWRGRSSSREEEGKEEKRGRRERKEEGEGDPVVQNQWRFKNSFVNRTETRR